MKSLWLSLIASKFVACNIQTLPHNPTFALSITKHNLTQAILCQESCQTLLLILLAILCLPSCNIFAGDPFVLIIPLQVSGRTMHLHPHTLHVPKSWQGFTNRSLAITAHLVLAVGASDDSVQRRVMDEASTTLNLLKKWCRVKWGNYTHCFRSAMQGLLNMHTGFR